MYLSFFFIIVLPLHASLSNLFTKRRLCVFCNFKKVLKKKTFVLVAQCERGQQLSWCVSTTCQHRGNILLVDNVFLSPPPMELSIHLQRQSTARMIGKALRSCPCHSIKVVAHLSLVILLLPSRDPFARHWRP